MEPHFLELQVDALMTLLEAHELYRFYHVEDEETLALRGVSLELRAGELVAVQGPSGSGKSTLISCLAGLDEPDGGFVEITGRRITRKSERMRASIRARHLGIFLQHGNLFDHLSIEANIAFQLHLADSHDHTRIETLLREVGISHVRHARPSRISGGEAARAGLAVALAAQPTVLLADEPTGEVDRTTESALLDLLDRYRKDSRAILIVTHSSAVVERADRVIHLVDGRIINEN